MIANAARFHCREADRVKIEPGGGKTKQLPESDRHRVDRVLLSHPDCFQRSKTPAKIDRLQISSSANRFRLI
jgi:hypothetical protein